jgi:hypothetical protein
MNKIRILVALCIILAVLSAGLAVALFQRPRFETTKSQNPYIMFDNKTAQACWSGPPSPNPPTLPRGFDFDKDYNSANIPFCKDLK